jgi:serine/threonine protein kinase
VGDSVAHDDADDGDWWAALANHIDGLTPAAAGDAAKALARELLAVGRGGRDLPNVDSALAATVEPSTCTEDTETSIHENASTLRAVIGTPPRRRTLAPGGDDRPLCPWQVDTAGNDATDGNVDDSEAVPRSAASHPSFVDPMTALDLDAGRVEMPNFGLLLSASAQLLPVGGSNPLIADGVDSTSQETPPHAFEMSRSAARDVDQDGNDTVNGYTLWQELGRGASGIVYLAYDEVANETRAIKAIPRSAAPRDSAANMMQEVAVMKKLKHKNIVRLYECIDDPDADLIYLVMQYVPDGPLCSLSDRGTCAPLPPPRVSVYAYQLGSALRYMHRRGVVHGDIKPDNILVDNRDGGRIAYFADFGVSRTFSVDLSALPPQLSALSQSRQRSLTSMSSLTTASSRSPMSSIPMPVPLGAAQGDPSCPNLRSFKSHVGLGTPAFLSPEVFDGSKPGAAADMWAFGVTLYALLFGRLPFDGASYMGVKRNVLSAPLTFPPAAPATEEWQGLLRGLLARDAAQRTTADELLTHDVFEVVRPISSSMSSYFSPMPFSPMSPSVAGNEVARRATGAVKWRES